MASWFISESRERLSVRLPGAFTSVIPPVTRVWSGVVMPADYFAVLRCMLATKVPRGTLVSSVHERSKFLRV